MKCKKCGRKQEMLFTSYFCRHCTIKEQIPNVKDLQVISLETEYYIGNKDLYVKAMHKKLKNKAYTFYENWFITHTENDIREVEVDKSNMTRYSKLIQALKKQILLKKRK